MTVNDLRKGRFSIIGQDYFVTFNTLNRSKHFEKFEIASVLAKVIYEEKRIDNLVWVIMPDHVHLLFTLAAGSLDSVIKSIKGSSARRINLLFGNFKWAPGYYDHAVRKDESRIKIARYIIANPLRAGIVESVNSYTFWDACYLSPSKS